MDGGIAKKFGLDVVTYCLEESGGVILRTPDPCNYTNNTGCLLGRRASGAVSTSGM